MICRNKPLFSNIVPRFGLQYKFCVDFVCDLYSYIYEICIIYINKVSGRRFGSRYLGMPMLPYTMPADISAARVREILLRAVRDTKKIDSFTEDVWITYCKDWNPEGLSLNRCVSLDPGRYRNSFLSDFLCHVSVVVQSVEARSAFTQRTSVQSRPPPICSAMLLQKQRNREVRHVVICVGQGELTHSDRYDDVFESVSVALPSEYATHSGAAVATFLQSIASGVFEQTVGVRLAADMQLSCVHFEGKFISFPTKKQGVHVNCIDNINNVLRAFGVDAGTSFMHMGMELPVGVLDQRLRHFVAAGCGHGGKAPYIHIAPRSLIHCMTDCRTKVLADKLLLQQIVNSNAVDNGVTTWWDLEGLVILPRLLRYYELNNTDTLVVHLHPHGIVLSAKKQRRMQPRDILINDTMDSPPPGLLYPPGLLNQ